MVGTVLLNLINFFGPIAVEAGLRGALGKHWSRRLAQIVAREEGLSSRESRALARGLSSSWDAIIDWTREDQQPLRDRLNTVVSGEARADAVAAAVVANIARVLEPDDRAAWIDARLADLQAQVHDGSDLALSAHLGVAAYSRMVARLCRWRRWELRRSAGLVAEQVAATFQLPDANTERLDHLERGQVRFIVAPVGSGKSDWVLSWLTRVADRAASTNDVPLPLLVRADATSGNFESVVRDQISLRHLQSRGADIVLDGLDEAGEWSNSLAAQAREFVVRWPRTRLVVTSRADDDSDASNHVRLEPMSDDQALALINSVRPQELSSWYHVDEQLRDAVHRPLFALFFALDPHPSTPYELIGTMAQGAGATGPRSALRDLAIAVMRNGGPIDPRTVPSLGEMKKSDLDRFLAHSDKRWTFVLPIFLQWFAAQGVIDGSLASAEYASSLLNFSRWRYVLALALSGADEGVVDRILSSVAELNPGAAAWLIKETRSAGLGEGEPDRPVVAADLAARSARILESLQSRDSPVVDGRYRQDAVTIAAYSAGARAGDGFDIQWRPRSDGEGPTSAIVNPHQGPEGGLWSRVLVGARAISPLSPWWWTIDCLKEELRNALEQPHLIVDAGSVIGQEFRHSAWVALTNYGQRPIAEVLAGLGSDPDAVLCKTLVIPRSVLAELAESGDVFQYWGPWLQPDLDIPSTNWVGGNYSHDALQERSQQVVEAAMEAYLDLADVGFASYGDTLAHRAEMPGTFVGRVYPPGENWTNMAHWFLPSSREKNAIRTNHAEIEVVAGTAPFYPDEMLEQASEAYRQRAQSEPEVTFGLHQIRSVGSLDIFGARPATSMAVKWLAEDLNRLGRLDGPRPIELR